MKMTLQIVRIYLSGVATDLAKSLQIGRNWLSDKGVMLQRQDELIPLLCTPFFVENLMVKTPAKAADCARLPLQNCGHLGWSGVDFYKHAHLILCFREVVDLIQHCGEIRINRFEFLLQIVPFLGSNVGSGLYFLCRF